MLSEENNNKEFIPYRQLTSFRNIQGKPYKLVLRESLIEKEGIAFGVLLSTSISFAAILIGLLLINNFLSQNIWKPFYQNLDLFNSYRVTDSEPIRPVISDINEFNQLSDTISRMTTQIRQDYIGLKDFTENASHEIQTPIAIIKSNIDLLLQDKAMPKSEFENLSKIQDAANRISKTNQALLLLAKIENNQFHNLEQIDLGQAIENVIQEFEEFIEARNITVKFNKGSINKVFLNPTLVRILLNNVIGNAIKHNLEGGFISIKLQPSSFRIVNSGRSLKNPPHKLFERFTKENPAAESTGLGLAIVLKISQLYDIKVTYDHYDNEHALRFQFTS